MQKRTYEINNGEVKQAIEKSGLELREFALLSLEKMNVKSKKKRIRQKALKKAFTQNEVAKEILLMVQGKKEVTANVKQEEKAETISESVSVRGLPVTFLLKLGKKYCKEEDVVRFYYNAEKEPFYKNKKLLEQMLESCPNQLDAEELVAFQQDVQAELDKRAKK
ncbi:hypothetical protein JCM9140_445 [Halalkalibacter wakoensis JCM 9140]|uniref:Uncharacterized protein n=1 Tax=Halalkalibacter wakoensis JCM 9140 TaxID=1236970 RepID=W4PXE5_9BACI|nr:hypothetical protein [Halalkalibacter wakoensis]GAE24511.1 hypothetical protein JCM9140_445 [Halalkalibacter wakoensis JCM 9140]